MAESLHALLECVDLQVHRRPAEIPSLHVSLKSLVEYLCTDAGRTPANCEAAGAYFLTMGFFGAEPEWAHLPDAYQAILWDMGAQLDDTFSAPEIAANFESTPEQLLARLNALGGAAGI